MINLRLANEYLVSPVFCCNPEIMGHIEINDLPLSEKLKIELNAWDAEYQSTFNNDYPPDSGFLSSEAKNRHHVLGGVLAKKMQKELEGKYLIEYNE